MTNFTNQQLIQAYQSAGRDFLAYKMEVLFEFVKTPEDMILHNAILTDILVLIEHNPKGFLDFLSESLLERRIVKAKKKWLGRVAERILNTTKVKG